MTEKYPTLERIKEVSHLSSAQGEFLNWIIKIQGFTLCEWVEDEDGEGEFVPAYVPIEKLLYEYYGIDEDQAEKERLELLEEIRRNNEAN